MTDYKQLCGELLRAYEILLGELKVDNRLAKHARATLAETEPEGPSDEELLRTYGLAKRDHNYEGPIDDWPKRAERAATVAGLRAVLARWGNHPASPDSSLQPVSVSERLPGSGDCDAEGECYWFDPEGSGAWYQDTYQGNYTHWIPIHVLPLPS